MASDLKKFSIRAGLFLVPVAVYCLFVLSIDPYDLYPTGSWVSEDLKEDISYKTNYAMWKMLEYRRRPCPNILLGDSRMMALDTAEIRAASGFDYFNFAYGGGSLREAIDTFWFAADQSPLERVYIGVNLTTFNGADAKNRVLEVNSLLRNRLLYLVNRNVLSASGKLAWAQITGRQAGLGQPAQDKETFWRHQIEVTTRGYYAVYKYPDQYLAELAKVAQYCHSNGIDLSFLVFPSHHDLQAQVHRYGLELYQTRMYNDLARLGRVYDFELDSALTRDRARFKDPYHFDHETMQAIVAGVWGHQETDMRILGPEAQPQ